MKQTHDLKRPTPANFGAQFQAFAAANGMSPQHAWAHFGPQGLQAWLRAQKQAQRAVARNAEEREQRLTRLEVQFT